MVSGKKSLVENLVTKKYFVPLGVVLCGLCCQGLLLLLFKTLGWHKAGQQNQHEFLLLYPFLFGMHKLSLRPQKWATNLVCGTAILGYTLFVSFWLYSFAK